MQREARGAQRPRLRSVEAIAMRMIGPSLAALAVLLAAILGLQAYAPYGARNALGIALGSASIAAMSLTLMLATRPRILEALFGGLDRMYVVHRYLGIAALGLMIGHNTIDPDLDRFVRETRLGDFASDLGEIALNGFIGLILISWIKRIPFTRLELPWPLWRFTHRFTGLLFAIAAFHQFAVDKPAGVADSLDWYMNTLCLLGLLAWLFTQFVAPSLRSRTFVLEGISRQGSVTELLLSPESGSFRWKPGQFAFVSAPDAGLSEPHPFTIASAPGTGGPMRLGIKALGGWTRQLPARLSTGQRLRLEGPYGRFFFRRRIKRQVWLAGGIGITPFLAWAEALSPADRQEIVLIWAVARQDEAFAATRLAEIAARKPGLIVHLHTSTEHGRLSARQLIELTPFRLSEAGLFYCGPVALRDAILSGLKALGQSPRSVHQEAFELR
jgi:predicted ferric reductase